MVTLRRKAYLPVSAKPLNNSTSMKLERKSLIEKAGTAMDVLVDMIYSTYFQMVNGVCIHRPITISQTSVNGMKIFQPKRMIWS